MINLSAKARAFINENIGLLTEAQKSYVPENARTAAPDWADMVCLEQAGIFDEEDYFARYPEVLKTGMGALEHFLMIGIMEDKVINLKSKMPSIIRQGAMRYLYGDSLAINWLITNMCNYNCSYCVGHDPMDKNKFSSFENIMNVIENLAKLNKREYFITFSGGEPTTHPYLGKLIKYASLILSDRLKSIHIISNGSRNVELYEYLKTVSDKTRLLLQLSLHTEYIDINHIDSIIVSMSTRADISLALMFNPSKRLFVKELFEHYLQLRGQYIFNYSISLLRGGKNFDILDERYTKDDFNYYEDCIRRISDVSEANRNMVIEKARRVNSPQIFFDYKCDEARHFDISPYGGNHGQRLHEGFLNFKNHYCIPGISLISINDTGYVKGGICSQIKTKNNIFASDWNYQELIELTRCKHENCGCAANDVIPKFANEVEAKEYLNSIKMNYQILERQI